MRPTSRRSKVIGLVGLGWFLFFVGSAISSLIWPQELRSYSKYVWTDHDILVCAICYVVVGSAGGIVAAKRLVVPLFLPSPRIGHGLAPCLASVGAVPEYELFRYFHLRTIQRSALWATFPRALRVPGAYVIVAQGPRFMGLPWPPPLPIHVMIVGGLAGIVALTSGIRWALAGPWVWLKWRVYAHCREPRQY